ncbi:MAG: DNA glycosylase [Candidatus Methanomethylophilaceae archaeon]|nr:DNA glycosylase [Candidatus Methanomethylophilaceae archaeon]
MHIELDVSLDPTLGCGQAHRWRKTANSWEGVLGNEVVTLTQTENGFDCSGSSDKNKLLKYFRNEDDLAEIIKDISNSDPYVANLSKACPGLRILRQNRWECLATYVLATNVNIKRIAKMTEAVCDTFGTDLGKRREFPTPKQILDKKENTKMCKLGFRENRFIELAERTENGEIDLDTISEMDYERCTKELMTINGVGPKVADCVALFAFDHLEAFPVDARISNCLESCYGITGTYHKMSQFGRDKFGKYAGYAQEFLYHSDHIGPFTNP